MGYFNELPEIAYQSPLSHKNSSRDYVIIKNIFRRVKLLDYLKDATSLFNKFVIVFAVFGVMHSKTIEKAPAFSIDIDSLINFLASCFFLPSTLNFFLY